MSELRAQFAAFVAAMEPVVKELDSYPTLQPARRAAMNALSKAYAALAQFPAVCDEPQARLDALDRLVGGGPPESLYSRIELLKKRAGESA